MAKAKLKTVSKTALRVQAALAAVIGPRLAADAKPDFSKALEGVNYQTFYKNLETKQRIIKLAKDAVPPAMLTPEAKAAGGGASPDDVIMRVLDMVEGQMGGEQPQEDQLVPSSAGVAGATGGGGQGTMVAPGQGQGDQEEEDPQKAKLAAILKSRGIGDDDISEITKAMGQGGQKPNGDEDPDKDDDTDAEDEENGGGKKLKGETKSGEFTMDKKAFDAALKVHGDAVKSEVRGAMRDAQEARDFVKPYVGAVSLALDSAEDIYRHALKTLKVDGVDTIKDVIALKMIIGARPLPNARQPERHNGSGELAMDAASVQSLAERFPHAAKIHRLG